MRRRRWLGVLAFTVTALECGVGVLASRAFVALDFWPAVLWGTLLDGLLVADMRLIKEDSWLIPWIMAGVPVGIAVTIWFLKR